MDSLRDQLQQTLGDQYRIVRELGGGGMSRVFLATETGLDRQVVLKVLPPDLAGGVSIERFKREIATAARLQHPHIVPLLATGASNGIPWFSMPFVEGETLRARLKHGELPLGEVVRMLRDVASALAYAHGRGVVHRDIKPENVLLSGGAASVTDFGVAKAVAEASTDKGATLTSLGVALGTPAYMAPEQAAADERTDHRADIYALGVMGYEMLAGHNPFGGRSPQATLAAHMVETPATVELARSATPPALARLVMRCLAKSAADRPQSAMDIVHELDSLTTPSGGTQPLAAASAVAFPRPRSLRKLLLSASAVTIVVAAGAWMAWQRARSPDLDVRTVAVLPFETLTGDSASVQAARVAQDWLMQGIIRTDSANVISSAMVNFAIGDGDAATEDLVKRVSRATRAGTVLTGNVSRFGDSLRISASIVNAATGRVIRAIDAVSGPADDPSVAINALRDRVLGAIASGDVAKQVSMSGQPPSYAAYQEYLRGVETFAKDQGASRQFFHRAIGHDSTFAMAYQYIAASFVNAGLRDSAAPYVERMDAMRGRLNSMDRLTADYGKAMLLSDPKTGFAIAQELARRSDDPVAWYLTGMHGTSALRLDVAIPALERSDSISATLGWQPNMVQLANAYHNAALYEKEAAHVELAKKRYPNNVNWMARRIRVLAATRGGADAIALADTILGSMAAPTNLTGPDQVLTGALEFEAHGDSATARRLVDVAIRWMRDHRPPGPAIAWNQTMGRAWHLLGQPDSAVAYLQTAVDTDTIGRDVGTVAYLAIAKLRAGDSVRARAVQDSLASAIVKWETGLNSLWSAALLAELGDKPRAVQLLKTAHQRGQGRANWHYHSGLRPLRGYAPFEALIKPVK